MRLTREFECAFPKVLASTPEEAQENPRELADKELKDVAGGADNKIPVVIDPGHVPREAPIFIPF